MQTNIEKALEHLKNADYAEYFEEIDKNTLSSDLLNRLNTLRREFTLGRIDIFFGGRLGVLTREIEDYINNKVKIPTFFNEKEDSFASEGYILEQLYKSLNRFEEVICLPSFFIKDIFPFQSKNEEEYSYINIFNLVIRTPELIRFFENIEVSEEKQVVYKKEWEIVHIQDYQEKLDFVIQKLNDALIFNIELSHTNTPSIISINLPVKVQENSLFSFRNLNFITSIKQLRTKDSLEIAYTHFLFGNYAISYELFEKLSVEFEKNKQYISHFICLYNLKKLENFIKYTDIWNEDYLKEEYQTYFTNITSLIINFELQTLGNLKSKERELVSLINKEQLFFNTFFQLQNTASEIIKGYYDSKKGATISNQNNIRLLKSQIARIDYFYTGNLIIFEKFKEFKNACSLSIEAFIASHAIKNHKHRFFGNSYSLAYFDDYLLGIMLFVEANVLKKYFELYELKELISDNNDYFFESLDNFFDVENDIQEINKQLEKYTRYHSHDFNFYYKDTFNTIMVILSYMKLDKSKFEDISIKLINFLKRNPYIFRGVSYNYINLFFYKKNNLFKNTNLSNILFNFLKFILLEIQEGLTAERDLLLNLNTIFEKYHQNIKFSKEESKQIIEACKEQKVYLLYIYRLFEPEYQLEIKEEIKTELSTNFNMKLWYTAMAHDLIDIEEFLDSILGNKFYYRDFINIAHQSNIDLSQEKFKVIFEESDFYAWVIDPENFDYTRFKSEWFYDRFIYSYLHELKEVPKVKYLLEQEIKANQEEKLKDIYFQYFVDEFEVDEFLEKIEERKKESSKISAHKVKNLFKDI